MKLDARRWALLLAIIAFAVCVAGCSRTNLPKGKMIVAASIPPLADFAKQVGGKYVDVTLLVGPGQSPHTYQIQPDQMRMLSEASVLVLNGVNLEFWADKAIDAANNPKLIVVKTADGLPTIDESDHGGGNPHVWLNPIYAIHQVEMIRDAYIKADPKHAVQYKTNANAYINKLKQLDKDIRAEVKTFKQKQFVAFHSAWVYFAREYGLKQAAVIEESPGKEPTPVQIKHVVDTIKRIKAKAIFAEPQFSPKAAEVIASETGAKVLFLDPLGRPPHYSYISMMRYDVAEMAKALK